MTPIWRRSARRRSIPVRFPAAGPNLEPRDDIWPIDTAVVIRQVEGGFEFTRLRWGFAAIYADSGRPSIPPEKLLQALFTVRSDDS